MNKQAKQAGLLTPRGVTWLGLVANVLLATGKVAVGTLFGSQTLLADGVHSASDLITDFAVLAGLRYSERPPDLEHHYGHERINTLVAMLVGLGLMAAAGLIIHQAVMALQRWAHEAPGALTSQLPFWVAVASIVVKEALYQVTARVGRRLRHRALQANAWHHRTDAFSSVAAAAGLAGATFGGAEWQFLDPVTALLLSGFLVAAGLRIFYENASELIDRAPAGHVMDALRAIIRQTPGVVAFHAFRGRQMGGKLALDVHVQVDPDLSVHDGHEIASLVRSRIQEAEEQVIEVIVHIEPALPMHLNPDETA